MGTHGDYAPPTDEERGIDNNISAVTPPDASADKTPLGVTPEAPTEPQMTQVSGAYDPYASTAAYQAQQAATQQAAAQQGTAQNPYYNPYAQPAYGYDPNMQGQPQTAPGQVAYTYNKPKFGPSNPLMDAGVPVKNNFAAHLVFGILEIGSVFFCNILAFIFGILGIVFAGKANKEYGDGKLPEFKNDNKTANVMLWIGGAFMALYLILIVIGAALSFAEDNDIFGNSGDVDVVDNGSDDDDDFDYNVNDFTVHPNLDNYNTFVINGASVTFPCTGSEFEEAGLYFEDDYYTDDVDANDYAYYEFYTDPDLENFGGFVTMDHVLATTERPQDMMIVEVEFSNYAYFSEPIDILIAGGITWDSTVDDVKDYLGEPEYEYISKDSNGNIYSYYLSYYPGDVQDYDNTVSLNFDDGDLMYITLTAYQ